MDLCCALETGVRGLEVTLAGVGHPDLLHSLGSLRRSYPVTIDPLLAAPQPFLLLGILSEVL